MQDFEDELEDGELEIQLTITTPNNQIRTFKGTPDGLRLTDWARVMEDIIDSEEKYAEANEGRD